MRIIREILFFSTFAMLLMSSIQPEVLALDELELLELFEKLDTHRYRRDADEETTNHTATAYALLTQFGHYTSTDTALLAQVEALLEHAGDLGLNNLSPEDRVRLCGGLYLVDDGECDDTDKYRTIDGACNNKDHPEQGRVNIPLRRFLPAQYADGLTTPRVQTEGSPLPLPNAREVSLKIATESAPVSDREDPTGSMLMAFLGQFLDHDLSLVPMFQVSCANCSGSPSSTCDSIMLNTENDPLYGEDDECMQIIRSLGVPAINCTEGPREHLSIVTSYMDASQVYGSTEEHAKDLRDNEHDATLRVFQQSADLKPQLPHDDHLTLCANVTEGLIECGLAGDERAAEQPVLTALHTVFVRLHNKLVGDLKAENPHWEDEEGGQEKIYQEARKIVGAIWQHVIYNEYLPALLGQEQVQKYNLKIKKGKNRHPAYDDTVDATISNVFATVAYRLGHSEVQNELQRVDNDHEPLESLQLVDIFFNAEPLYDTEKNGVNGIILGTIQQPVDTVDRIFESTLIGKLFFNKTEEFGLDLFAINVQRAREHGIPGWMDWRKECGLSVAENWDEFDALDILDEESMLEVLKDLYGDVKDIDPFPGFMLEKRVEGGRVGESLACILGKEFKRLRIGDRFWYENIQNKDGYQPFTTAQVNAIKKMTLARIFCDNLDEFDEIQQIVLMVPDEDTGVQNSQAWAEHSIKKTNWPDKELKVPGFSNHRVSCTNTAQIPAFDITPWKESN